METKRVGLILIFLVLFCKVCIGQEKLLKKSWIKHSIEDFSTRQPPDTSYLRYTFENSQVLFGFEPAWHEIAMPFSIKRNLLTIGFDRWTIEALTDSTLTIFLPGFRRMRFYEENYLLTKDQDIVQIGEYKGKPLYKANEMITPRYKKTNPLIDDIKKQDRSDDYNIRKAGIFLMSFIVTDEGKIEDPKIIKGVAFGFDANLIKELLKTSTQWYPATIKGRPIQTLMTFEIKFLDSLDQH
jgi:hypothetical protein